LAELYDMQHDPALAGRMTLRSPGGTSSLMTTGGKRRR
jgi:hypothetical protein